MATKQAPPLLRLIYELTECVRDAIDAEGLDGAEKLSRLLASKAAYDRVAPIIEEALIEAEYEAQNGHGENGGAP